ncbi:unnamed protein product [Arabis nemorensis]|uniref:Uncharacterized protein n=1 Tax=Arabis nemorensis TaxID=586526 RepID=A0A565B2T4_9BRAS|nr:unnamed protein product [Arabis nemorensis]
MNVSKSDILQFHQNTLIGKRKPTKESSLPIEKSKKLKLDEFETEKDHAWSSEYKSSKDGINGKEQKKDRFEVKDASASKS